MIGQLFPLTDDDDLALEDAMEAPDDVALDAAVAPALGVDEATGIDAPLLDAAAAVDATLAADCAAEDAEAAADAADPSNWVASEARRRSKRVPDPMLTSSAANRTSCLPAIAARVSRGPPVRDLLRVRACVSRLYFRFLK